MSWVLCAKPETEAPQLHALNIPHSAPRNWSVAWQAIGRASSRCAGVGHFNNNFKVADDIRLLGAVPEEEEEREVPIDKHMAKAMEERLLKGIEQEMLRDKQAIIRSFMKDSSGVPSLASCGHDPSFLLLLLRWISSSFG